jgi:hypothetical protein
LAGKQPLEVLFINPGRVGGQWVDAFLTACYGGAHRVPYASPFFAWPLSADELKDSTGFEVPNERRRARAISVNGLVDVDAVRTSEPGVSILTLLRDPLARICSDYLAFKHLAVGYPEVFPRDLAAARDSIVAFCDRFERADFYCRFFSGTPSLERVGPTQCDRATQTLKRLDCVGFLNQPARMLDALARLSLQASQHIRTAALAAAHAKVKLSGKGDALLASLDANTISELHCRNSLDFELLRRFR